MSVNRERSVRLPGGSTVRSHERRHPPAGTVIHSDQGVQFGSWVFTQRAKESGLLPSMGSIGDCYDIR